MPRSILAPRHGLGHGTDKIRVVAGFRRVGAEIAHRVALAEQESLEGFLVLETGMVGTDGDGEFLHEGPGRLSEGKETRGSCGCR
jgi:hypothetical protein